MKAVSATITAASTIVTNLARPAVTEVTAGPRWVPSMASTLRPERSGNVTAAGRLEVALGREPGPFGTMTGGDRCGRIAMEGT